VTHFYTICRYVLLVVFGFGCASTRYEEFGDPPKEELMRNSAVETMPLLERRIQDLETRVGILEAELVTRFTGIETSQGDLATRVMVLAEQLEALSKQVQNAPKAMMAQSTPSKMPMKVPAVSLDRLYEQGLSAYYDRKYETAQEIFERLLADYPNSNLADNAQYWIGECEYGQKHYQTALDAFHKVFQFDKTEKDDDAQFMLGQSYHQLGNFDSALVEFNRLKIDYPNSEYIGRAEAYIRRIRAAQNAGP
jgi:TolA-binding protein